MNLTNYRDISKAGSDVDAGFQFEFSCQNCSRAWKSPFKPYRKGQLAGLFYKFAYYLGDRGGLSRGSSVVANVGSKKARDSALQDALELAEERYAGCPECKKTVCEDCWDKGAQSCTNCLSKGAGQSVSRGGGSGAAPGRATSCSNCGAAVDGGRFCAECGFDMASTHKSCPGCGVLNVRSARFCPECGHGF